MFMNNTGFENNNNFPIHHEILQNSKQVYIFTHNLSKGRPLLCWNTECPMHNVTL